MLSSITIPAGSVLGRDGHHRAQRCEIQGTGLCGMDRAAWSSPEHPGCAPACALGWKTAPSLVWIQTLQTLGNNDVGCLPISASTALNSGAGDCFHQVEKSQGLSQ